MDIKNLEQMVSELKQRQNLVFATNCIEVVKKREIPGFEDVVIGQMIPMYCIMDEGGNLLSSTQFCIDEKKPPIDGKILHMFEEAFGSSIIFEDLDCEVFVGQSLRKYRYVLLEFDDMFTNRRIYPLIKDEGSEKVRNLQPFYQILEGRKETCTKYYGPYVHLPDFPMDLDKIYTVFEVRNADGKLNISPLVFEEKRNYIRPLPVLLGASFTGESQEADGEIRADYSSDVDRMLMSWRFIKHTPDHVLYNWEDLRDILDGSKYIEESKKGT